MKKIAAKINIVGDDQKSALSRLTDRYHNDPYNNKGALLNQMLAIGTIMKESGLSDILLDLDTVPDFRKASAIEKGRIIRQELRLALGNTHEPNNINTSAQAAHSEPEEEKPQKEQKKKAAVPNLGQ